MGPDYYYPFKLLCRSLLLSCCWNVWVPSHFQLVFSNWLPELCSETLIFITEFSGSSDALLIPFFSCMILVWYYTSTWLSVVVPTCSSFGVHEYTLSLIFCYPHSFIFNVDIWDLKNHGVAAIFPKIKKIKKKFLNCVNILPFKSKIYVKLFINTIKKDSIFEDTHLLSNYLISFFSLAIIA